MRNPWTWILVWMILAFLACVVGIVNFATDHNADCIVNITTC